MTLSPLPRCLIALIAMISLNSRVMGQEQTPQLDPPQNLQARDTGWDNGTGITLEFALSPDDLSKADDNPIRLYEVQYSQELYGVYQPLAPVVTEPENYSSGRTVEQRYEKLTEGVPHYFRVRAVGRGEGEDIYSEWIITSDPAIPTRQMFNGQKFWLLVIMLIICGSVVVFIGIARTGRTLKVRKIAGLEAVDEAVGRATEMGRSCLFIPGIQDINEIQTVAGLTILSRVARTAAEYDALVEVPTSRSLVMTTARETVQSAYLSAGRPDAYNEDNIYYVTDEQFGYVAYLSGHMVREKPAACFYMGSFYAESLILAETGNSIGAIQIAGTAQPTQLPFFVAACDYTLIGEEFFAASAYLSGDPNQLGSLKGQDVGKLLAGILLIVGCILASFPESWGFRPTFEYIQEVILK